ncbi:hypothetical protein [Stenoxybacter acetivorans]|uniref:hypothetical protein n=1 Tax=Stenoxybacter acetivorans TaxID=422441 RepID=UPI00055BD245|nr:hypothetical protein [Stenoxybacter acetivorans]
MCRWVCALLNQASAQFSLKLNGCYKRVGNSLIGTGDKKIQGMVQSSKRLGEAEKKLKQE